MSSLLIREAIAATRWYWPNVPDLGLVTFVDPAKVKPTIRHGERTWGYCYRKAGFHHVGYTVGGLLAFQLLPNEMPPAEPPLDAQLPFTWPMLAAYAEEPSR